MATDNHLLDEIDRTQRETTRRRRDGRSRRYQRLIFATVGFVALIVLALPSLVSHSGMAQSMLASQAEQYGWQADAGSIDVGWITPLSVKDLKLTGQSGETSIELSQIDTSLTVLSLLQFDPREIGEVTIRGANVACTVASGTSSIESDLAKLLEPSEEPAADVMADLTIQDLRAAITDKATDKKWLVDQSNVDVHLEGAEFSGDFGGAITEPSGSSGSVQSHFAWKPHREFAVSTRGNETPEKQWELSLLAESFPMSILNLCARRMGNTVSGIPTSYSGDTTGQIRMVGAMDGGIQAALEDVRIRGLQTSGQSNPEARPLSWSNELATLDGELSLANDWLFGHGLELTTDFASATVDGAFPTTITLTGADDNPISWLQSLDGKARVDVDLAALDRALPGLMPLRAGATLVQGRTSAAIKNSLSRNSNGQSVKRSQLTLSSDALRARSGGRPVTIDPITVAATVVTEQGQVRAESFSIDSQFATASGSGSMQTGNADFQVDFGRLYAMLRPIVDFSDTSLGGTADGSVRWNITAAPGSGSNDRWELSGDGQATQLLVTLPDGHRFKRAIVKGQLSAVGRFNGKTLQELTTAEVALHSGGVAARAELLSPVARPTADSLYAVRLTGDGRLENLSESLRPWIPETIRDAEGRVSGSAIARLNASSGSLTQANFDLAQPRIAYANQWYSQPNLKVDFKGAIDWPSGEVVAEQCTVAGQAISLAVKGSVGPAQTLLDVAWKADLEQLMESVGTTVARAQNNQTGTGRTTTQLKPVSYRPVKVESHRVAGICEGRSKVTQIDGGWRMESELTATNLAVYSPTAASVTPPGTPRFGSQLYPQAYGNALPTKQAEPLWSEPQVILSGPIEILDNGETIKLLGVRMSNEWFEGTLTGESKIGDSDMTVHLNGPTRWDMSRVADRLTELLGTPVAATGIHESPIDFQWESIGNDPAKMQVTGDLGWDACEVFGVTLGQSNLPFRMTEQKLSIAPTRVPLKSVDPTISKDDLSQRPLITNETMGVATASFAAEVDYASTPMMVQLKSGSRLDGLQITPSHAQNWLQYLTPLAAGATRVDGIVGADLDEALIEIDHPSNSRVRGRLNIQRLRLSSGPLADQLIQGVAQIKSIVRQSDGQVAPAEAKTWIEMPAQNVDFAFSQGVVSHERMFFRIDRAQVMTSGQVNLNSEMQMVAQVPLDTSWLGDDLQSLSGESITLPVTGSLSKPQLDVSSLRQMMTQFGVRLGQEVIESRLDGFLQKQLGSGFDKINEQFGSGLEKILDF